MDKRRLKREINKERKKQTREMQKAMLDAFYELNPHVKIMDTIFIFLISVLIFICIIGIPLLVILNLLGVLR